MQLLDLPDDVLTLVFVYLRPRDFLALCSSSRLLYENYHTEPSYWRIKTSDIFRTPISPLLQADGARWYHLFQRLSTQTRLYTWGQGLKGNLGHGVALRDMPVRTQGAIPQGITPRTEPPAPAPSILPTAQPIRSLLPPRRGLPPHRAHRSPHMAPRLVFQRTTSTWPTEAHVPDEVGVIADLQCGGWSTVILSSAGRLYATGSINSANYINVGSQTDQFERLEYLTQSNSAIASFSAGRCHILALTDDKEIISWDRINAKGLKVQTRTGDPLKAVRVVGGWGESSAYVPDTGLIYWLPLVNDQEDDHLDARPTNEKIIPGTTRSVGADGTVFEVIEHVVLEGVIVYLTSTSKLFAVDIGHENQEDLQPRELPTEIPGYFDGQDQLKDIQGSFRHFVVFTESGRVLTGNLDYIHRCFEVLRTHGADDNSVHELIAERPSDVPALQRSGVIAVRFGDWHYHALYNNGTMTSHGHEPQSCGALGLGDAHQGGRLRGLITGERMMRQDTNLRPIANLRGRQIWFEPEKREWLRELQEKAKQENAASGDPYWLNILNEHKQQTVFSEWIEQEGRHWSDGPQGQEHPGMASRRKDDHHLDAYFVLAIGAAGWHSGALVLVDEEKAQDVKQRWEVDEGSEEASGPAVPGGFQDEQQGRKAVWSSAPLPLIQLPQGIDGPRPSAGDEQTSQSTMCSWRDGMPTLQGLGLA